MITIRNIWTNTSILFITICGLLLTTSTNSYASTVLPGYQYYCCPGCGNGCPRNTECCADSVTSTDSSTHVITTTMYTPVPVVCSDTQGTFRCDASYSYKCASGYYGRPTSNTAGACKECPSNATCSSGTSFECNIGYYKDSAGTGCTRCPEVTKFWPGTRDFSSILTVIPLPIYGTTSGTGKTSVNDCYVTAGNYYDTNGNFKIIGQCNYN